MVMLNIGLLILRLALGLTFMGHGSQKLFGWFGGGGMRGTTAMMQKMGLRAGVLGNPGGALGVRRRAAAGAGFPNPLRLVRHYRGHAGGDHAGALVKRLLEF